MTLRQHARPFILFLFFLSLYLFTFNTGAFDGHFYSIDGKVEYEQMKDIVQGDLSLLTHPRKHLGLSLAEIPFYLAGNAVDRWSGVSSSNPTAALLVGPFVGSLVCVFMFLIVRLLSTEYIATMIALLTGLGTLIWPYSKADTTDSLFLLTILAVIWCLLHYKQSGGGLKWFAAGLIAMAAMYVTKLNAHVFLPGFLFYVFAVDRSNALPLWKTLAKLAAVVAVWCLFLPLSMAVNKAHSQSYIWGFFNDFGYKIMAREFSPIDGLLWYMPLVVVALASVRRFIKDHLNEFILIAILIVPNFIVIHMAKEVVCLHDFGGRYDIIYMPLLLLPAIPFLEQFSQASRKWRIAFFALVILSVYIQFLGTAVSILYYANVMIGSLGMDCHGYIMSLKYSPFYVYPRLILQALTGIACPVSGMNNISGSIDMPFTLDYFWSSGKPLFVFAAAISGMSSIILGLIIFFRCGLSSSFRKYSKDIAPVTAAFILIVLVLFVPKTLAFMHSRAPIQIANGNYETITAGRTPEGWTLLDCSSINGRPSVTFSSNDKDVREGAKSLQVTMAQDCVTMSLVSERFPVKGGEIVDCSCAVKSLQGVPVTVRIALFKDSDPFYYAPTTSVKEGSDGWKKMSSKVLAPGGTKEASFLINVWTGGLKPGASFIVDDVKIEKRGS